MPANAGAGFPDMIPVSNVHPMVMGDVRDYYSRELVNFARCVLAIRRKRERILVDLDLGEPAWDILLDLFVSEGEGRQISVSSVCLDSTVPPTTILRQINALAVAGYLERVRDEHDGRRVFAHLTEFARLRMTECLQQLMTQTRAALFEGPGRMV